MSMVPQFSGPFGPPFHNEFQSFHDDAFRNFQAFHNHRNFASGFGPPHGFPPMMMPMMPPFPAFPDHHHSSAANWKETDTAYVMKVNTPTGLDKLEMEIQNNSVIHVFGEKKKEKADRGSTECSYAMFDRKFKLPGDADVNLIQVKNENNGVTVITVPKRRSSNSHGGAANTNVAISG